MARLPFVTREDLPESERHIYDEAAKSRGLTKLGKPFEELMSSPEASARIMAVGTYLRSQSKLPENLRELVSMAAAREMNCDFEQNAHTNLSRKAGVSEASITAVEKGTAPAGLQPEEASVIAYTLELLRTHHVKDETFKKAHKQLGTKNLVDLTTLIGYYALVSLVFNAVDLKSADVQSK
jgi:4-carboxymuconolactone decarboxylase